MTAAAEALPQPIPDSPRVETRQWRSPAAHLDAPPAEQCSREQLLKIAAEATGHRSRLWALICAQDHVRRICELLVREVEPEAQRASGLERELLACQVALDEERNAHQGTILDLEQEQDLREEARGKLDYIEKLLARVSAENIHLRHQLAGTTPASVLIALDRAARPAAAPIAAGSTDDDTKVVDVSLPPGGACDGGGVDG